MHAQKCPSLLQCITDVKTAVYMDFSKNDCPNVSSPCWIPQAANVIHEDIIHSLPQCDTFDKYICMLQRLRKDNLKMREKCIKSCKAQTYRISSSQENLNTFKAVYLNLS